MNDTGDMYYNPYWGQDCWMTAAQADKIGRDWDEYWAWRALDEEERVLTQRDAYATEFDDVPN